MASYIIIITTKKKVCKEGVTGSDRKKKLKRNYVVPEREKASSLLNF